MHLHRLTLLAAALAAASPWALAVDSTLTPAGYTGLGITPNAHLLPWGNFEATYDNQLPGVVRDPSGHNFVAGFGLLPNLEISGRIAANTLHSNCYTQGCGARDLSASAKVGIGLDAANRFHIAAGMTDFGGHVTYFRTYYGVLTYDQGPWQVSGGVARRTGAGINGSRAPLHGPFAAAAWQPLPLIRAHVEYTDRNAWAGVRLFAPHEWLPEGWSAHVGANQRLNQNALTRRSWWTAGLSIPLYKVPELRGSGPQAPLPALSGSQQPAPSYEARTLPPVAAPTAQAQPAPASASTSIPAPAPQPAAAPATAVLDSHLTALAEALKAKGLEDISVGRMPDGSIAILANNAAYNWNSADALGAALGAVSRTLGFAQAGYRLVLTQRQTPLVAVTGQTDCLRQWVNHENATCTAGQLSTPGTGALEPLHEGAAWTVRQLQPSWQTLRVAFSPVLRTNVATEYGVFDYSAALNVGLQLPLWQGASVEWRGNAPLAHSSDYKAPGVFSDRRIRSGTERLALTQTVRVPLERWLAPGNDLQALRWGLGGLTAQGTVGRIGSKFDGAIGALRWEPGQGRHRLSGQAGYFHNAQFDAGPTFGPATQVREPLNAKPLLASYRYNVTPTRTSLEATGGQFMNNDRGFQLGLRQWFSDVSVGVYFKRTQFRQSDARTFVGLEVSLPIGPRRDMTPAWHLQATGTPRFTHAVETLTGQLNAVTPGHGVMPPAPTLDAVFNSDRAGLVYFEDNLRRIRDAAR